MGLVTKKDYGLGPCWINFSDLKFMFGLFAKAIRTEPSVLASLGSLWFSVPSVCLCAVKDASLIYAV